jgi:hypothetical protein
MIVDNTNKAVTASPEPPKPSIPAPTHLRLVPQDDGHKTKVMAGNNHAVSLMMTEAEGTGHKGKEVSGHKASMFLRNGWNGCWINEHGMEVKGYLFWKPSGRS